jgi:hypothetical protein
VRPATLAGRWHDCFGATVCRPENAEPLEQAAKDERLGDWTKALTRVVVETCQSCGFLATARGHKLQMLPVAQSEYLSLDVVAFTPGEKRWQFPAAVFELENSGDEDRIAYSLWKLLCVKAELRVMFCYRKRAADATPLVRELSAEVVKAMAVGTRSRLEGETLVVVGNRGDAETFPYGYFRWWMLDAGTASFDLM